jgi:uncharacterized membrane protein
VHTTAQQDEEQQQQQQEAQTAEFCTSIVFGVMRMPLLQQLLKIGMCVILTLLAFLTARLSCCVLHAASI